MDTADNIIIADPASQKVNLICRVLTNLSGDCSLSGSLQPVFYLKIDNNEANPTVHNIAAGAQRVRQSDSAQPE